MKIYTSYFGNLQKIQRAGIVPISVSLWPPKWYSGLRMPELAPEKLFINWPEQHYKPKYQEKLDKLNAKEVLKKIIQLSGGKDVAICCYEKPNEFCHRQMIADWLRSETGEPVEEFGLVLKKQELF